MTKEIRNHVYANKQSSHTRKINGSAKKIEEIMILTLFFSRIPCTNKTTNVIIQRDAKNFP